MVWLSLIINRRRRPQFKVNYGVRAIDPTDPKAGVSVRAASRLAGNERELHSIISVC